jgi:6-phosphogluconate dehydrogenase
MNNKPNWGIIGLGVMGTSLSRNFARNGVPLALYNRHVKGIEEKIAEKHCSSFPELEAALPFEDLNLFVNALESPRKILLMLPAGLATDSILNQLKLLLTKGDVIIEGGNSHYEDTEKRAQEFASLGIHFLGMGVSGGEEGALKGPSLMLGGAEEAYPLVAEALESIAAKNSEGSPCCAYLGSGGAGHFVKMVHNGIEYAEMQLLAEAFELARANPQNNFTAIHKMLGAWQNTSSKSYLLEITHALLKFNENGGPFIDLIKDEASNKGTGAWATAAGAAIGNSNTLMAAALHARFTSSNKEAREKGAERFPRNTKNHEISLEAIKKAYDTSRLINHHQGFEMIRNAAQIYGWKINLSTIARLWSEGCIIKSDLMYSLIDLFKSNETLLEHKPFMDEINSSLAAWEQTLEGGLKLRIPLGCISSAWHYFLAITQKQSNANLIQAQRDYFGAHGFKRTDSKNEGLHHGPWATQKN